MMELDIDSFFEELDEIMASSAIPEFSSDKADENQSDNHVNECEVLQ